MAGNAETAPGAGAGTGASTRAFWGTTACEAGGAGGALPQAAKLPKMATSQPTQRKRPMTLILLEALGAGLIFVAIVWWTMFSGRKNGELPDSDAKDDKAPPKD
jgi:hypothetical protein